MVDYSAAAKKYGATIDYGSAAQKYGGSVATQPMAQTDTQPQEKFGGPAWLGSKQMSAQDFLKQSKPQQYFQAFAQTLPKSLYDFFVKAPTELAISAGEVPTDIYAAATGQEKIKTEYNIPFEGKMTSIQSQAKDAMDKGAKPFGWKAMVLPSLQTIADGLATKASLDSTIKGLQAVVGDWNITNTGLQQVKTGMVEKIVGYFQDKGTAKQFQNVLDDTMPKLNVKDKSQAISQSGKPGGATPAGILKPAGVEPTPKDIERATETMPFFDKNPIKFATNLNTKAIPEESQKVLGYLEKNVANGDPSKLIGQINAVKPPTLATGENASAIERVKQIASDIITSQKDTSNVSLWKARTQLDQELNAAKEGITDPDRINSINIAVRQIRNIWNNYIQDITTQAGAKDPLFLDGMSKLHNYYTALDNLGDNYAKTVGGQTQWAKNIGAMAKWAGGATGLGGIIEGGKRLITGKW